jgi:hypothetical protein
MDSFELSKLSLGDGHCVGSPGDAALLAAIRRIHTASRRQHGVPRVLADLARRATT